MSLSRNSCEACPYDGVGEFVFAGAGIILEHGIAPALNNTIKYVTCLSETARGLLTH